MSDQRLFEEFSDGLTANKHLTWDKDSIKKSEIELLLSLAILLSLVGFLSAAATKYLIRRKTLNELMKDARNLRDIGWYIQNEDIIIPKIDVIKIADTVTPLNEQSVLPVIGKEGNKVRIFISYAHVNENIRRDFESLYLKAIANHYNDKVVAWSDIKIKTGSEWDATIKRYLYSADIVMFFISNAFLASDYIKNVEIQTVLENQAQKKQIIFPIMVEQVSPKLLPFPEKQFVPSEKPIRDWKPQSKGWLRVQDRLLMVIEDVENGNICEYFN